MADKIRLYHQVLKKVIVMMKTQASVYEVCDRMRTPLRTPLRTPETLETCKKSAPCLIKKASRCATNRTSKATFFIFHFL